MKIDKPREIFLDTTFLLPFFQIDIATDRFTTSGFESFIKSISTIHASELSVYEAKAKIHRLARRNEAFSQCFRDFGDNLTILREDKKFVFHPFSRAADQYFNHLVETAPELNSFDAIIISQASQVGLLLTEDQELLNLRRNEKFQQNVTLSKVAIKQWKELA